VQKIGRETISDRRYTEAQVAIQQARAKVQTFGMTPSQVQEFLTNNDVSQATGAYDLLSPQDGTVISDNFLVGERIEPGQVLFELTDESSMWIEARLSASESRQISKATPARISLDGMRWIDGEIVQIAHSLDDQTRTRAIRIEIDNRDDLFHTGEFVQVEFRLGTDKEVLAVPASSIVTLREFPAVFRMTAGDELHAVLVETGRIDGSWVEIRTGISAGDEIAIEGVFALKAELLKLQGGN
jgi:cobalt-zinc-cadmium efflux system membrane fusion protein